MKKLIFKDGDIARGRAFGLALGAVAAKVALSLLQYATVYPPLAPLDDDLMFRRAESIVRGQWLGRYGPLTLGKHMFFSLWLALLHILKIPYLAGNALLWAGASAARTGAFGKFFRKNYQRLIFFLALLFNPAVSAQSSTRIYRDSIFPALCLILFSCCVAASEKALAGKKSRIAKAAAGGVCFGCILLCREDGVWVLPFVIRAFAISRGLALFYRDRLPGGNGAGKKALVTLVLGAACFALGAAGPVLGYRYMNYKYYGRFIVSDFSSGEFPKAYGAMTRLRQDEWNPMVAVPRDVREDLYREVRIFAPVKDALASPKIENGYKNPRLGDFRSGSFYWALRVALADMGVYDSPKKSQAYFEELYRQIKAATDEGRLALREGGRLRRSLTPPLKVRYIGPVAVETGRGFLLTAVFGQCDPLAERAVGTPEEIKEVEDFIHQKGAVALIENTEIPYLSPARAAGHRVLRLINAMYSILCPVFLAIGFLWQIKTLRGDLGIRKLSRDGFLNIILLGLMAMAVFRCAMIAFMEVAAFGIGTYVMYLSTVHPLLIIYRRRGGLKTFEY